MNQNIDPNEGYNKALSLLHDCATPDGFVASPSERDNYQRVWSRDGTIISLAGLLTGNDKLIETARQTFETLAEYQGPHGEIPSNVDTATQRISYGGTTGRVDANLWFLIGCGEYWQTTGDEEFLERLRPAIEGAFPARRLGVQQPRAHLRAADRRLGRRVSTQWLRALRPVVVPAGETHAGAHARRIAWFERPQAE